MSRFNDMLGARMAGNGASAALYICFFLVLGGVAQTMGVREAWKSNKKTEAVVWSTGLTAGMAGGVAASYYTWEPLFKYLYDLGIDPTDGYGMSENSSLWFAGTITASTVLVMTCLAWNVGGFGALWVGEKLDKMIENCQGTGSVNGEVGTSQERLPLRPNRGSAIVPV